jgi:hypothetical protein
VRSRRDFHGNGFTRFRGENVRLTRKGAIAVEQPAGCLYSCTAMSPISRYPQALLACSHRRPRSSFRPTVIGPHNRPYCKAVICRVRSAYPRGCLCCNPTRVTHGMAGIMTMAIPPTLNNKSLAMPLRFRQVLLTSLFLSGLSSAHGEVVPRIGGCPRGYIPDGNYCVSQTGDSRSGYNYGGYPQLGPPIIEKDGNCPPGYHPNRMGKKCLRDGLEAQVPQ